MSFLLDLPADDRRRLLESMEGFSSFHKLKEFYEQESVEKLEKQQQDVKHLKLAMKELEMTKNNEIKELKEHMAQIIDSLEALIHDNEKLQRVNGDLKRKLSSANEKIEILEKNKTIVVLRNDQLTNIGDDATTTTPGSTVCLWEQDSLDGNNDNNNDNNNNNNNNSNTKTIVAAAAASSIPKTTTTKPRPKSAIEKSEIEKLRHAMSKVEDENRRLNARLLIVTEECSNLRSSQAQMARNEEIYQRKFAKVHSSDELRIELLTKENTELKKKIEEQKNYIGRLERKLVSNIKQNKNHDENEDINNNDSNNNNHQSEESPSLHPKPSVWQQVI